MDREPKEADTVTIKVEHKDGGIYISSDDVPGLWLWGSDPEQVFSDIVPTIRELYKLNNGRTVDVEPVERPQTSSERLSGIENMPDHFRVVDCAEGKRDQTV